MDKGLTIDECYDNLKASVVAQAVIDYKNSLIKHMKLDVNDKKLDRKRLEIEKDIYELESFFRSDLFLLYCPDSENIDVESLINKLKKDAEAEYKAK